MSESRVYDPESNGDLVEANKSFEHLLYQAFIAETRVKASMLLTFLKNHPEILPMAKVAVKSPKAQLKHRGKNLKQKGGKAPVDYHLIDLTIDLETALRDGLDAEMIQTYLTLARLIHW